MRLLVTVGTTKFDKLIETILTEYVTQAIHQHGYTEWRMQVGAANADLVRKLEDSGIAHFSYKPSIEDDIEWADLVIGHAGAGTILDVLRGPVSGKGRADRPALLVVGNEQLMDNHQQELTQELKAANICHTSSIKELSDDPDKVLQAIKKNPARLPSPNLVPLNQEIRRLLS